MSIEWRFRKSMTHTTRLRNGDQILASQYPSIPLVEDFDSRAPSYWYQLGTIASKGTVLNMNDCFLYVSHICFSFYLHNYQLEIFYTLCDIYSENKQRIRKFYICEMLGITDL